MNLRLELATLRMMVDVITSVVAADIVLMAPPGKLNRAAAEQAVDRLKRARAHGEALKQLYEEEG